MPQAARSASQEYWRPADPAVARIAQPILAEGVCPECGAVNPAGARFCHLCGTERHRRPGTAPSPITFADFFDIAVLRQRFGLSVPCVVFFIAGIVCMVIASGVGILYKAENLMQWQAMQFWRVEWILGAVAAMLAAIVLKK